MQTQSSFRCFALIQVPPPLPDPGRAQLHTALRAFGTIDPLGTDVGPHVTLVPGFRATPQNALAALRAVARALTSAGSAANANKNDDDHATTTTKKQDTSSALIGNSNGCEEENDSNGNSHNSASSFPLSVRFCGVGTSESLPFRALVLEVEPSPELLATRALALETLSVKPALPTPFPASPSLSQQSLTPAAADASIEVAVSPDDAVFVDRSLGTSVQFCDEFLADTYAPHVSLSYGAPLSAHNKALARAHFLSFPSSAGSNAATTDSGATAAAAASTDGVPVEASIAEDGHKAHGSGRDVNALEALAGLEFGGVALSGLSLVALEGTEWAIWVHVATVDLAAPTAGS